MLVSCAIAGGAALPLMIVGTQPDALQIDIETNLSVGCLWKPGTIIPTLLPRHLVSWQFQRKTCTLRIVLRLPRYRTVCHYLHCDGRVHIHWRADFKKD
jgi:hypothetical protein